MKREERIELARRIAAIDGQEIAAILTADGWTENTVSTRETSREGKEFTTTVHTYNVYTKETFRFGKPVKMIFGVDEITTRGLEYMSQFESALTTTGLDAETLRTVLKLGKSSEIINVDGVDASNMYSNVSGM